MARRRFNKPMRQQFSHVSYMQPFKETTVVKLSDLASPSLGEALRSVAHKEMDMKTAWAISKIMEDRQAHLKTLETTRQSLLERYCEKDEEGKFKTNESKTQYLIKEEKAYNDAYAELTDVEVECTTLKEEMMEKLGTVTPAQLLALKPFIS